jgi:hypothetical protein
MCAILLSARPQCHYVIKRDLWVLSRNMNAQAVLDIFPLAIKLTYQVGTECSKEEARCPLTIPSQNLTPPIWKSDKQPPDFMYQYKIEHSPLCEEPFGNIKYF